MPNPDRNRITATCQYASQNAMMPVQTVKTSTAHHVTRTRPSRSDNQPARIPPMPIPSSV
jgi:hypothetical protein